MFTPFLSVLIYVEHSSITEPSYHKQFTTKQLQRSFLFPICQLCSILLQYLGVLTGLEPRLVKYCLDTEQVTVPGRQVYNITNQSGSHKNLIEIKQFLWNVTGSNNWQILTTNLHCWIFFQSVVAITHDTNPYVILKKQKTKLIYNIG